MKVGQIVRVEDRIYSVRDSMPDDLFLVAASFEPRSVRASELITTDFAIKSVVFQYEDTLDSEAGRLNTRRLKDLIDKNCGHLPSILPCKFSEPFSAVRVFERWLQENPYESKEPCITIDVTCFTKLHLLLLLKTFEERIPQATVRILYTEPYAYATAFGRQLSHGILDTFYIPLNSGEGWSERAALIVFLGHEPVRVERVIEEVEADETVLIQGRPGFSPEISRMSERLHRYLLNRAEDNAEFSLAACSTYNFDEVGELLAGLLDHFVNRGLNTLYISPLGTKLQALGLEYLRRSRFSTRLVLAYPAPLRYERKYYSHGTGPVYSGLLFPSPPLQQTELIRIEDTYYLNPFEIPVQNAHNLTKEQRIRVVEIIVKRYTALIREEFKQPAIDALLLCAGKVVARGRSVSNLSPEQIRKFESEHEAVCFIIERSDLQDRIINTP